MIFSHIEKMNRRLFFHALLALLLLLAQQGAALHALSHLTETVPAHAGQEKSLPHSPVCDKCVAYAEIGGGVHSAPLVFHAVGTHFAPPPMARSGHTFQTLRAYSSRAPPSLA